MTDSSGGLQRTSYECYAPELLAKVLYNEGIMGIGWDEADPDTSDERYHRCLLAARAALDSYWYEDTPLQPGVPLGPPATSVCCDGSQAPGVLGSGAARPGMETTGCTTIACLVA